MAGTRRGEMPRAGGGARGRELRVGTSGYHYDDWPGRFYPRDLPPRHWLEFYAHHFDTREINASFYRLPEASTFAAWRERAPSRFVYAVKFSRFGTHNKKLLDALPRIRLS